MATRRKRGLRLWCIRILRQWLLVLGGPPSRFGTARRPETVFLLMEQTMMSKHLYCLYGLSISHFAREVGVNRTYITRALNYYELDFARYVNGYRLQHAITLMQGDPQENISAEEIAQESGFLNERRLKYCFRHTYGISVAVFRKRIRVQSQAKNFSTALRASGRAKTATRS